MRALFPIAVVITFASCTHLPKTRPEPSPPLSQEVFWEEQRHRREQLDSVTGKVWIKYQGRREGLAGKGRLTFKTPSEGRWEIRDPLGRVQYLAVLTPGDFTAYYPSQKLAFHDESSGRLYLKHFLGMDIGFAELQRLMLGVLPQPDADLKGAKFLEWRWDPERGLYRGVFGRLEPMTVFVSPDGKEIRELEWAFNKDLVKVQYGDFDRCCTAQVPFPFGLKLALEKAKTAFQVQWDSVEDWGAKATEDAFSIALPEGTEVRKLK